MGTGKRYSGAHHMNKSLRLQDTLMLAPLIGITDTLVTALGLWLLFVLVVTAFGLSMAVLRARMLPTTHLLASVLLAATWTSCAQLAAQIWSLPWHQHLGIYAGLVALQCVVLEHAGFFRRARVERLKLCALSGALLTGFGLLREFIGNGTFGNHFSWLAGAKQPDWQGWLLLADGGLRLVTLAPGGFILLGLLLAAWQAWHRSPPSH
jgi:electron transport complex protein RnfE